MWGLRVDIVNRFSDQSLALPCDVKHLILHIKNHMLVQMHIAVFASGHFGFIILGFKFYFHRYFCTVNLF